MFERDSIGSTLVTETVQTQDEHHEEEGACCIGCKVEGFIAELKASTDANDQKLSVYFQGALNRFNEDQERAKRPAARGC